MLRWHVRAAPSPLLALRWSARYEHLPHPARNSLRLRHFHRAVGMVGQRPRGSLGPYSLLVRESELLTHIYARSAELSRRFPFIVAGPGHDCAAIRVGDRSVLLKVDQLVEGRHFVPGTPIDLIARKAMARPLSDIAASAGTPLCALAGAMLPEGYAHADELFDALSRWALHWNCPLVGGDIASGAAGGGLSLSISVVGMPHLTRGPVLRSGAQVGDGVYVTGALGGSLAADGGGKHLTFEPRFREARFLADTLGPRLHAMMDISDGLGVDAGRLARTSSVAIEIDEPALPMTVGISDWRRAVGDGEDYELLFAAAGDVPNVCRESEVSITRVGRINSGGSSVALVLRSGTTVDISRSGWDPAA